MSRILVCGAGAIGQWIGSRMALCGESVTVLVRPAHCEAIRANGIVLREGGHTHHIQSIEAASDIGSVGAVDWIFITTKAYDVEAVLDQCKPLLDGTSTRVVSFQNGIGSDSLVASRVGDERTFICSVTKSIRHPQMGVVEEANRSSGVGLAPHRRDVSMQPLVQLFEKSGVPFIVHPDGASVKWSKLLLNILGNASCAILDMSTAEVFSHKGLFEVEARAFREAVRVMKAMHLDFVALPGYQVPLLKTVMTNLSNPLLQLLMKKRIAEGRGNKAPSLRLDMDKKPPRTEVGYLNGAVMEYATRLRLGCSANSFITRTLLGIVQGEIPWERYRQQPEVFLADYRAARAASRAAEGSRLST